jgi:hypothetical protein
MKCSGDNREALYMLDVGKTREIWEPHCHICFEQAVDSVVPIRCMSMDAYERMMKQMKVVKSA